MATAGIATANAFGKVGVTALKTTGHVLLMPLHIIGIVVGSIVAIIIIIIIVVAVSVSTSSSFTIKPLNILKNTFSHTNKCTNKCTSFSNNQCSLSNPNNSITSLSDKQSQSMVGMAIHRSSNNLQKQKQLNSFASVNKATKLKFGDNTYKELTSFE